MAGRLPFALGLRGGGGGLPPWMRHAHRRFTSQRRFSSASENAPKSSSPTPKNPGGPIRGALSKYNSLNESYPTVTKVGTTVAIVAFGDTMAQRIQHNAVAPNPRTGEKPEFKMDWRRLAAFASFGGIYTGYFQIHWFRYLRTVFPRQVGINARFMRRDVLGPLLANQMFMVCIGYYPFFFAWTGFVRGRTPAESLAEMKKKYKLKLLAQNWAFWLPAQGVMFALVPASYHIAFTSACGLVWNTLLSLLTLERIPEAKAELKRKKA
tara:strand:- start:661 stop:1458 length:798 start_codon:yes stop_codon:yes gene_type:complete